MKKEENKQIIDILEAYINGKQIQHYGLLPPVIQDAEKEYGWYDVDYFSLFDLVERTKYYRVKPKNKPIPFEGSKEFYNALKKHGGYIYCKYNYIGEYFSPVNIREKDIFIHREKKEQVETLRLSYEELYFNWLFVDNTPCRKEE